MATPGDLAFARFPITLDVNAAADVSPQVGLSTAMFMPLLYDVLLAEILPITGTGGKSKGVVVIIGREV